MRLMLIFLAAVSYGQALQKFRTFHPLDSPEVQKGGRTAVASDGVEWKAAARGLYRGTEYFAGKRYLPDDEVVALAPDAARGMWVRTRTGSLAYPVAPEMTLWKRRPTFEDRISAVTTGTA